MTRAQDVDRRIALDRARDLVRSGATLAEAAAAVSLTIDQVKKRAGRERWRASAPTTGGTRPPIEIDVPEPGTPVSGLVRARLLEALTDTRTPVRDLLALEQWAVEDERRARAAIESLEHVSDAGLRATDALVDRDHPIRAWDDAADLVRRATEAIAALAEGAHYGDPSRERSTALDRARELLSAPRQDAPADDEHAAALEQARALAAQHENAAALARHEAAHARAGVEALRADLARAESQVRGLEALLAGRRA